MQVPDISFQFLLDGSPFSITILIALGIMLAGYGLTRWTEFLLGAAMVITVTLPVALK